MSRRGGIIEVQANGKVYDAKGDWDYNLGKPKRDPIIGSDKPHGYKETPQMPFCEGAITDDSSLALADLVTLKDATVTLRLANDKTVVWEGAWYAGEGTVNTGEGEIAVRFESREEGEEY